MCIESILCLEVSGNETCRINGNMSVSVPGISVEIHSHIEEWIAQVKWELLPRHGAVLYAMASICSACSGALTHAEPHKK